MVNMTASACMVVFLSLLVPFASAGELRRIQPIPSPAAATARGRSAGEVEPIRPEDGATYAKTILAAWNGREMGRHVAADFYDRSRLLDAMSDPTRVPGDARARLVTVDSVQTLEQHSRNLPGGGREIVRTVSVTATSQVEFNDPARGFRRLEGTNEYILRIVERED